MYSKDCRIFRNLTDKEVKGFVVKKFGKCIKSTTKELYSKLDEEKSF